MARPKTITIRLTEQEADGLMTAGNAGIADLLDSQDDEYLEAADRASEALDKLGMAMAKAWPEQKD